MHDIVAMVTRYIHSCQGDPGLLVAPVVVMVMLLMKFGTLLIPTRPVVAFLAATVNSGQKSKSYWYIRGRCVVCNNRRTLTVTADNSV